MEGSAGARQRRVLRPLSLHDAVRTPRPSLSPPHPPALFRLHVEHRRRRRGCPDGPGCNASRRCGQGLRFRTPERRRPAAGAEHRSIASRRTVTNPQDESRGPSRDRRRGAQCPARRQLVLGGAMRNACAWVAAAGLLVGSASSASAQEAAAVRQEIDQLRRDFETLKQQYGDRLTALESKLAAVEGAAPAAAQPPAAPPAAAQPPATRRPPTAAAGASGRRGRRRAERRAAGVRLNGRRRRRSSIRTSRSSAISSAPRATIPSIRSRRSRCTSRKRRSRRSSIRMRAPTSSCRSARRASTLEEGFVTFRRCPAGC